MKRILALCLCLMVTLTGCLGNGTIDNPETMSDGTPWNRAWTGLGGRLGVEQPGLPFALFDTNGDLPDMEMYYASWVCGEVTKVDDDTSAYDGQIYLLTETCGTAATAADTMQLWREQIDENDFQITQERTFTAGGVEFTLVSYDCPQGHFAQGITALGVWKDLGILVDAAKTAELDLDLTKTMEAFLEGFHYAQ